MLNLWQKNGVFKIEIIQPLLDMAAGSSSAGPGADSVANNEGEAALSCGWAASACAAGFVCAAGLFPRRKLELGIGEGWLLPIIICDEDAPSAHLFQH